MSNTPTTVIKLPSRGVLYDGKIPDGEVTLRKWTMHELQLLESSNIGPLERVRRIIDACLILPNGFNPDDLLTSDRFAVLLAQRSHTFATTKYNYDFRCSHCGKVNRGATCDIVEDFNETLGDENTVEPMSVVLPESGVELKLRFLRGKDEMAVLKKADRARAADAKASDPSSALRIAHSIVEVVGRNLNMQERELFAAGLSAYDVATVRTFLEDREPCIDTTLYPTCAFCSGENKIEMPMGDEFFRPTVRVA